MNPEPHRPHGGRPAGRRPVSLAGALSMALLASLATTDGHAWPSERYAQDPVSFFTEVLGVEPWSKQIEIIEAVRDCPRVAVRSGHKVSKSCTGAGVALWFFCSFADARVVMSSVTARQVDAILWRELSMRHARARVPIGGELAKLARTGLRSDDFREVVGFTAKEAEAVAGISGSRLLYILDEASGIPEAIFEAIEGNRAGGARVLMLGNPTKTSGTFYDAFHAKRNFYRTIHVSSEETPNVIQGRDVVPGLATRAWVEEKRAEWGEDSALYLVRVRGEFPREEARKVVQLHLVTEAEERWEETPADGRLHIGVDSKGTGDDALGLAARRGQKILQVKRARCTGEAEQLEEVIQFVRAHRMPHEGSPVLKVDATGATGAFASKLRAAYGQPQDGRPAEIDVISVDFSVRCPDPAYPTMRDALWFGAAAWLRAGGALPPERLESGAACIAHDKQLSPELTAPAFSYDAGQRLKVEPKEPLRSRLGRSTDGADAVLLAVFESAATRYQREPDPPGQDFYDATSNDAFDPYAAVDAMNGRRRRG